MPYASSSAQLSGSELAVVALVCCSMQSHNYNEVHFDAAAVTYN